MENSIAQRIRQLRKHYDLGVKEFASLCALSHVAVFHLENGKTLKPHRSSIQRIATVFGSTVDWILYGRNEMLPNGPIEIYKSHEPDDQWKDETIVELRTKNALLEKELERLWNIVSHFTNGNKPELKRMLEAG